MPPEHTDLLVIPHEYPAGVIRGADVERRLLACEETVDKANASRAWIANRQEKNQ